MDRERAMATNDSLSDLLTIVHSGEFEDTGRMRVVSAHWSATRLTIRLQLDHGTDAVSAWQLRFTGILEYLFADVYNCGLNVTSADHPAIDQYLQAREFLHFGSAPNDPHHVVGELWAAHSRLTSDWIPFDRYLNREIPLHQLLGSGSGLLATGPTFLIAAYADVLETNGCRPTRKTLATPPRTAAATLTHFGDSYVVAEQVVARRLPAA